MTSERTDELLVEETRVVRAGGVVLRIRSELDVPIVDLPAFRAAKSEAVEAVGRRAGRRWQVRRRLAIALGFLASDGFRAARRFLKGVHSRDWPQIAALVLLSNEGSEPEGVKGTLSIDALLARYMRAYGGPLREAKRLSFRQLQRLVVLAGAQDAEAQLRGIQVVQFPNLKEPQPVWAELRDRADRARWWIPDQYEVWARERKELYRKLREMAPPRAPKAEA